MTHAVLRALELRAYQDGGYHDPEFLPRTVGMPREEVEQALSLLEQSGQVQRTRHGYQPLPEAVVDTGADPERARGLRLTFAELALQRLRAPVRAAGILQGTSVTGHRERRFASGGP